MSFTGYRVRIAAMISGILVIGLFVAMGGSLTPSNKSVVLVQFGMYPDEFEGLEVFIDDEPAGRLRRFGNAFKTGFEVEDGDHEIRVKHPELACQPGRFSSGPGGRTVMLILDFSSRRTPNGESESVVVFTH